MALGDAFAEIAADWPRLSAQLSGERRLDARRQLAAAAHGARWRPGDLLRLLIGNEPEHPAWAALRSGARRTALAPADPGTAAMQLRWLLELDDIPAQEPTSIGSEIAERAELRVWLAPMRPAPPRAEGIVTLPHDGQSVSPAFQFDDNGTPLAVVVKVNRALDADEDPWGAASWWLAPHAALHAIPADAVRHGREDDVLAAARTIALQT